MAKELKILAEDLRKLGKEVTIVEDGTSLRGWGMLFMKKSLESIKDGLKDVIKFTTWIADLYDFADENSIDRNLTPILRGVLTQLEDLIPRYNHSNPTFTLKYREGIKKMGETLRNNSEAIEKMLRL